MNLDIPCMTTAVSDIGSTDNQYLLETSSAVRCLAFDYWKYHGSKVQLATAKEGEHKFHQQPPMVTAGAVVEITSSTFGVCSKVVVEMTSSTLAVLDTASSTLLVCAARKAKF